MDIKINMKKFKLKVNDFINKAGTPKLHTNLTPGVSREEFKDLMKEHNLNPFPKGGAFYAVTKYVAVGVLTTSLITLFIMGHKSLLGKCRVRQSDSQN